MSQVLYRIEPGTLGSLLEKVSTDRDSILGWAPIGEDGKYIDDGTYVEDATMFGDGETPGIGVKVVHLDVDSLPSMESDLSHAILELLDEPAFNFAGGWYVTHYTVDRIAEIIDRLNRIHSRVSAVAPSMNIAIPRRLDGVIDGATSIPAAASLHNLTGSEMCGPQLIWAMRRLAELNNASHRAEGHGKSWEPGFRIVRSAEHWTITLRTYQFWDTFRDDGDEHIFSGTWDEVAHQIRSATAHFAQKYDVAYDEEGLDDGHPVGRLTSHELASLPDGIELVLGPESVSVVAEPTIAVLEQLDVGIDVGALIALTCYVVTAVPDHALIGDAIGWRGDRFAR